MAILNRFSTTLLYCDSMHLLLLAAGFLAIPGRDSVPLRSHLQAATFALTHFLPAKNS